MPLQKLIGFWLGCRFELGASQLLLTRTVNTTNVVCWVLAVATCAATYDLFFSPSVQRQRYLAPVKPAVCAVGIRLVIAFLVAPYLQARIAIKKSPIFHETCHYTISSLGVHV